MRRREVFQNEVLSIPTHTLRAAGGFEDPGGVGIPPKLFHEKIVVRRQHEGGGEEVQMNVSPCNKPRKGERIAGEEHLY